MKEIVYKDCNNNAEFIKNTIMQVQEENDQELIWNISDLEIVSILQRDYIEGTVDKEIEKVFQFGEQVSKEHEVCVNSRDLINILEYTKTIYNALLKTSINGESEEISIKIFDGDIITISDLLDKLLKYDMTE